MPKKYQPSNGTEGMAFMGKWCDRCRREVAHREDPEAEGCDILTAAMVYDADEEEYPEQWTFDDLGLPCCTGFYVDENAGLVMRMREDRGQLRLF